MSTASFGVIESDPTVAGDALNCLFGMPYAMLYIRNSYSSTGSCSPSPLHLFYLPNRSQRYLFELHNC
jgi:hypothetical protein